MQLVRPAIALDEQRFGKRREAMRAPLASAKLSGDLKLFGTTFLAGFVFVSLLIA